jgi:hypothetical protein
MLICMGRRANKALQEFLKYGFIAFNEYSNDQLLARPDQLDRAQFARNRGVFSYCIVCSLPSDWLEDAGVFPVSLVEVKSLPTRAVLT